MKVITYLSPVVLVPRKNVAVPDLKRGFLQELLRDGSALVQHKLRCICYLCSCRVCPLCVVIASWIPCLMGGRPAMTRANLCADGVRM